MGSQVSRYLGRVDLKVNLRRYKLSDGGESVLQNDTSDISLLLVARSESDGHSTSNALPIDDYLCASKF